MAATEKGVWDVQDVRDKQLAGEWRYTEPNTLWAIGRNQWGQAGQNVGHAVFYSSPTQIGTDSTWGPISTWSSFNGGGNQFGSLKTDGTLWAWGYNNNGQFGLNDRTNYSSPVQMGTETTWNSVIMSYEGAGTKTDGTMWAWGRNEAGELGHNNTTYFSSPVQLPGTNWSSSEGKNAKGAGVTAATKTDGTLWVWGNNSNGSLGLNQAAPVKISSPTQIPGTTWNRVSITENTGLATKTDGTLWAWGYNGYGTLGVNDRTNRSSPIQIPGTTWLNPEVTSEDAYVVRTDGTLWVMGRNQRGELGIGDQVARSSPVQVPGTTWKKIAAGYHQFAAGVKTDGTLWSWGYNADGQLGQNQNANEIHSPVQIPGTSWDDVNTNYNAILATQLA